MATTKKKKTAKKAPRKRSPPTLKVGELRRDDGQKLGSGRRSVYKVKFKDWPKKGSPFKVERTDSRRHPNFKTSKVVETSIPKNDGKLDRRARVFKTASGSIYKINQEVPT